MKRCVSGFFLCLTVVVLNPPAGTCSARTMDLGDSMSKLIEADWIETDRRFTAARSGERNSSAKPSSKVNAYGVTTMQDASGGCDGVKNGRWGFHTASSEQDPWWQVDLQDQCRIDRIVIFNRTDGSTAPRTRNIRVLLANEDGEFRQVYQHNNQTFYGIKQNKPLIVSLKDKNLTARVVRLHIPGKCSFALDEVEVYSTENPQKNIALGKPADQKSVSQHSYPGTLPETTDSAVPPKAARVGSFEPAHTREVVEHGKALLARLRADAEPKRLNPLSKELKNLEARLSGLEITDNIPQDVRREIYLDARRLVRRIAFCNPLLDFDKLLFIKRHDSVGVFHMCDQYYGCNARPGGGLFVLSDPFGPNPRLTNVLENSVVEKGRLKADNLSTGAFLSPDLSYDGKTILFAYTSATTSSRSTSTAADWCS